MTRKRTFLERDEWKTMPWAEYPDTKTSMHYLQDMLCDLPGFCEDRLEIDAIAARGGDTTLKRRTLEMKLIVAFRQLVGWRWKWDTDNPNIAYEKPINLQTSLTVDASGYVSLISFPLSQVFDKSSETYLVGIADRRMAMLTPTFVTDLCSTTSCILGAWSTLQRWCFTMRHC